MTIDFKAIRKELTRLETIQDQAQKMMASHDTTSIMTGKLKQAAVYLAMSRAYVKDAAYFEKYGNQIMDGVLNDASAQ